MAKRRDIRKKNDVWHEKFKKTEFSTDVTFCGKNENSSKKAENVLATEGANVI